MNPSVAADPSRHLPLSDYGLIGDCRSAALVSRSGSIDWLCWPNFDSPSVFGRLLDYDKGGHFALSPLRQSRSTWRYVGATNVLEITFETPDGSVRLTDFMPALTEEQKRHRLVPFRQILRRVEGLEGSVAMQLAYSPSPLYTSAEVDLVPRGPNDVFLQTGRRLLHLRASIPIVPSAGEVNTSFVVRPGDVHHFALAFSMEAPSVYPSVGPRAEFELETTLTFWEQWSRQLSYRGPNRETVLRSALLLKLLSFAPSGAIIAAPTTSLPEVVGARYNWDYRYCWLRDAAFTVRSLYDLGFSAEGDAFVQWMLHATRLTHPELQVVYDVYGEARLPERELGELDGYRGSRPVRVGNEAYSQFQADVYGEVLSAVQRFLFRVGTIDRDTRGLVIGAANVIAQRWEQPDAGIWEERQTKMHHVHSKVMAWLALDAAIRVAEHFHLKAPIEAWRRSREAVRAKVLSEGFNPVLGSFARVLGGHDLDAGLLALPLVGFLPGDDPRMVATIDAIQRETAASELVFRRRQSGEDLFRHEGAFLACSFWLVECLARAGRVSEAHSNFERLLARCNDLGLLPEEIDPDTGEFLGNYPQGFSHLALVGAALTLQEAAERATAEGGRRPRG